ncbi:hypothetical protein SAMN05421504_113121 [Amycolatopsis xylanica]|uniref:Xaa-Pro dipeptidyl-peptidase C-terminal domain-containing protein n=1 Tax=Amycolatopsis xylanica TaxID=589385 RepID=A0A1H3SCD5_9PSEU|nr:CocE/NonD family hydrolase [Amycolatopsis xylanica]SDZ35696.1 hypothetical protein SAMN05421504_113121 [Amycolatopsis xylanica]
MRVERDLRISLRDGVVSRADLYRTAGREPRPTLLQRTPYGKAVYPPGSPADVDRLTAAGYNLLVQDVRGRWDSAGVFEPYEYELGDGYDTIEWIGKQDWATDAVGMLGSSYEGAVQWQAAVSGAPNLRAIAPHVTSSDFHEGWTYQGGAFQLGFCLRWVLADLTLPPLGDGKLRAAVDRAVAGIEAGYRDPSSLSGLIGRVAPYYQRWLEHPVYDDYWRGISVRERYAEITKPALSIGGWYDIFVAGTVANYAAMRRLGVSQRLIVGPWSHCLMAGRFPEREYGPSADAATFDLTGAHLEWFDEHVRYGPPSAEPPVRLFVMGADEWRGYADWPPPEAQPVRLYLHSNGSANTRAGDGVLAATGPEDEHADVFRYDPADPVRTGGGSTLMAGLMSGVDCGPLDQRSIECRADVLCYSTEALAEPVTVVGMVTLVLYAESSAVDTDFTAKLVDVAPDGRAEILCDGILRARYRDSLSEPRMLTPHRVHELRIEVGPTANVFRRGHRVRLEVSSSNFPRFDLNPNTGGSGTAHGAGPAVVAVNRVHHSRAYPSHLVLPILPQE